DAGYRTPMAMVPTPYFYTADRLLSKACSFDDPSGFNTYLSEKFSAMLRSSPTLRNITHTLSYDVELDAEGKIGSASWREMRMSGVQTCARPIWMLDTARL